VSGLTLHWVAGDKPLAVLDLHTGRLYINRPRWDRLAPHVRRFVLLHEQAHWASQSDDELLADQLAFVAYVGEGYRPSQASAALAQVLQGINTDLARVRLDFMRRRVIPY
jgi:hypothetical protein